MRAGTENLMGFLGLSTALEFSLDGVNAENDRLFQLRNKLRAGLVKIDSSILFHENEESTPPDIATTTRI